MVDNESTLRSSKLIRIDSKDRDVESLSQYNFKVSLNDFMVHNIKRILLKSVSIPNTQYNINSFNNIFTYNDGTADRTLTVPLGQYTIAQLMDELIILFAAAAISITMSYVINALTKKITMTVAPAITILGGPVINGATTISKKIGLDPRINTASLLIHTFPNQYNMIGLLKVYIGSHTMTRGTTMTSSDKSHIKVFTEIPIRVAYGEVEHRVLDQLHSIDEATHSVPFNLSNIDISLYDQNLNILELNGLDVQIVLKVFDD